MLILGVMTGTSCDGLDAVCLEFDKNGGWSIRWARSLAYPKPLRERILRLQLPKQKITLKDFLKLDRDLGLWYGKSISKLLEQEPVKPDLIANHGQTVAHFPDDGSTLQLGDPSLIAEITGLTVVSHFREGDMAAGGQGAPLLPLFHRMLASKIAGQTQAIAIHNLGGISNLTYIDPSRSHVMAFDTGPSNIWIDEAMSLATRGKKELDFDGATARKGWPDISAVKQVLKNPYFNKQPPKSTGRDDFPFSVLKSKTRVRGADLVATATALTVESIAAAYERFILKKGHPLQTVYFAGGGAKNTFLMELLATRFSTLSTPVQVKKLADAGIEKLNEQALEASGFAMFGYLSLRGLPIGGSWTGAKDFGPPGWITPGKNWCDVALKIKSTFAE